MINIKLLKVHFLLLINISIAFLILPILGIYLASFANLFDENISYIGNTINQRYLMYIWGNSHIFYFYIIHTSLLKKIPINTKQWKHFLLMSCIFMELSLLLPYQPEHNLFLSQLHIYSAFIGTITFIILTFFILFQLTLSSKKILHNLFLLFQILLFICIFIIFYYGMINSLVELLFSNITTILLCIAQITSSLPK